MPDLIMHHFFGRKVLKELAKEIEDNVNLELYDFATAGPDPFFFVSFLKPKINKESFEFGGLMHRYKTQAFFQELINVTKENKQMFSYLCGFLTHYYLDSTTHPYVFYSTGNYEVNNPKTIQYRGLHTKLERAMDCYIIKNHYDSNPYKFKIYKEVLKLKNLDNNLKKSFNQLYKNVYQKDKGFKLVNQTIKDQRKFYKFIYDPFGIKNKIFTWMDNNKSSLDYSKLSYYDKLIEDIDIFNLKKKEWCNPVDKNLFTNQSFFELINRALDKSVETIDSLYQHIFNNAEFDINRYIKNISYITGLDCDNQEPMQYFNNIFAKH